METKILQVFYGNNALPYKDQARQVHYPNVGSVFTGENNATQIKFYVDRLGGAINTTWVANIKKPNGQIVNRMLGTLLVDTTINETYVVLDIADLYTELMGSVFISLQGYSGNTNIVETDDGYEINGTPTIVATGVIQVVVNYAPQFLNKAKIDYNLAQEILAKLSTILLKKETPYVVESKPTQASVFDNGQLIYDKTTKLFYRVVNGAYQQENIDIGSIYVNELETLKTYLDNSKNHISNTTNPHNTTKAQVGLGDVVNSGDSATPTQNGTDKFTTGGAYTLKNSLDTLTSAFNTFKNTTYANKMSDIAQAISDEATARATADTNLTTRIGNEESARASAISTLTELCSNKVNVVDIINDLSHIDTNKPLSAYQGKVLNDRITQLISDYLNSTDTNLDTLHEIVQYITNNKSLIDNITTNKINKSDIITNYTSDIATKPLGANVGYDLKNLIDTCVKYADIVNDLTHTDTNKPLSAKQGKELKTQIDTKQDISTCVNDNDLLIVDSVITKIKKGENYYNVAENVNIHAEPTPILYANQMVDTHKLYLYIGNESGYSNGYIYYYNGDDFVLGTQYLQNVEQLLFKRDIAIQTPTTEYSWKLKVVNGKPRLEYEEL